MEEYNVILTWEAIYDIAGIADYIELMFGREKADLFQRNIKMESQKLSYMYGIFQQTQIWYRNYVIYKKPFLPSLIFYIVKNVEKEVHILRVLREECDWGNILKTQHVYTY